MNRMPMIHSIQISTRDYDYIVSNIKHFEIRKDDNDYQVGDFLIFEEWENEEYLGRNTGFKIEYILRNCPEKGLMNGYCIIGW